MPLAAFRGEFAYDSLLFLHILTVIVGFGSTFVYPLYAAKARAAGPPASLVMSEASIEVAKIVTTPVIYAAGVLGLLLVFVADDPGELFKEAWLSISMLLYLVAVLFSAFVHVPNLRAMVGIQESLAAKAAGGPPPAGAEGGPPAEVLELEARGKRAGMNGGILHLAFAVVLVLMVFKP
jgi:uncharacterized membrane protein